MNHIANYIQSLGAQERFELPLRHEDDFQSVRDAYIQLARTFLPNWEDRNPELIDQICYYMIGSRKFKGDITKGIIFMGKTGTGKTVMLKTLCLLFGYVHGIKMKIYTGRELEKTYSNPDYNAREKIALENAMKRKLMAFDDIGEEHASVKVYGSELNVGVEVLTERHLEFINHGHLTFITTNLNAKLFGEKYGARIESRIYEMANFVGVNGEDLRKTK